MDLDFTDNFIVTKEIKLKNSDTKYVGNLTKAKGIEMLITAKDNLRNLQEKLYADGSQSLLIVLQAMDAAGKDSLVEHVFSGVNPQGCDVKSFKTPSTKEYSHDFLWRHYHTLPEKGKICIFNRSHYESVLVCKVYPEYNLKEKTWKSVDDFNEKFWQNRYESINDFEKHLTRNGTQIVKLFLHVSKEEQKKRFLDRIDEPDKNWKFSSADITERSYWDKYQNAYEEAINATSTKRAPWHIIPADNKWFARLTAIQIIIQELENMHLNFPILPGTEKDNLELIKQQLQKEI